VLPARSGRGSFARAPPAAMRAVPRRKRARSENNSAASSAAGPAARIGPRALKQLATRRNASPACSKDYRNAGPPNWGRVATSSSRRPTNSGVAVEAEAAGLKQELEQGRRQAQTSPKPCPAATHPHRVFGARKTGGREAGERPESKPPRTRQESRATGAAGAAESAVGDRHERASGEGRSGVSRAVRGRRRPDVGQGGSRRRTGAPPRAREHRRKARRCRAAHSA